ncbi:hypothetical protein [Lachnospira sp.]|jgi:hypothetical protein|uniref:hypothetical protein n=1 Tax=Lachnospira sp. TaxID=2049031 RepID=UPI00257EBACD|nr:hypothetical protein [Lachnospira sp.]
MTTEEQKIQEEQQIMQTFIINSNNSINLCMQLYEFAVQHNLQNTQVFINWQDRLNKISVMYPNIIDITNIQDTQETIKINDDGRQNQNS